MCASKDSIEKVSEEPTEWEKIFANYTSEKVIISRICEKKFLQLKNKKTAQFKNEQKIRVDIFPKKIHTFPGSK